MTFWQKCVWVGAALLIVVSLLTLTRTAETSSPAVQTTTSSQPEYYAFQDSSRSETHYAVREDGQAVIYSSVPTSR